MKAKTNNSQADSVYSSIPTSSKEKSKKRFFSSFDRNKSSFFGPKSIQPKLKIGQPNDKYEQEADRVADAVMRMPDPAVQRQPKEEEEELQMKQQPEIQRKCEECEKEEKLQRKRKVQTKSADSSGDSSANLLFENTEVKYKQSGPGVMTHVQEAAKEPMVMGDWKAWIGNGEVINNSSRDVTVWSGDRGTYTIPAHSRSERWGEDVDHIRDIHGQWWKIGWNTAVVDSNGEVSGAKCRSPGRGQDCGQLGDYPAPGKGDRIYTKLKINQPNNPFEQEADAVAEKVVNGEAAIQRKCTECEEEKLQKKSDASTAGDSFTSPELSSQIKSGARGGSRLPEQVQSEMGQKMGADFGDVSIHTDSDSYQMNQQLGARAFTHGNDIFFNEGEYNPASNSGKRLLAHELTHVVQQDSEKSYPLQRQLLTESESNELCYQEGENPSPDASEPEAHYTYESWISSFHGLREFRSDDTIEGGVEGHHFRVLGGEIAERYGGETQEENEEDDQTEAVPIRGRLRAGEQFIDHPTERWVQNCLPSNLRVTAYELPSDCADIAVILRHVWLSAHNRSERYNGWNVGDRQGEANQSRALNLIREVGSYNAEEMVNAYSNRNGDAIQSYNQLQTLLHPGDILVWEHRRMTRSGERVRVRRTGGHVQTISNIARDNDGSITRISVLQGNLPIFEDSATEIADTLLANEDRQERYPELTESVEHDREEAIETMRDAPARRIEVSSTGTADMTDPADSERQIWGRWDDRNEGEYTVLVAAGPPRSASRPAPANRRQGRRILDWNRRLSRANRRSFTGKLEAMLQEARSLLERDQSQPENQVSESDFQALATSAGNRFRRLNIGRNSIVSLETEERINYLQQTASHLAIIEYLGNNGNSELVLPRFNYFAQHFVDIAAPGSTVEELRSYVTGTHGPRQYIDVFQNEIQTFSDALDQAPDFSTAQQIAESNGRILWQHAVRQANDSETSTDDRPLYWARLRMIQEIRYFSSVFNITGEQREDLVDIFERNSRGQETAQLSSYPYEKKVVISGFDPFGLHNNIDAYNPSGAAVLALDGQTISNGDISAAVEGVIFPVRFRDFNEGNIEQFFGGYLTVEPTADMIMTISRGGSKNFEVERYAGRRRSSEYQDNEAILGGGTSDQPATPPRLGSGDEFLETSLPHEAMTGVEGVEYDESRIPDNDQDQAVEGSGGGYLSNEIFYRVRRLSIHAEGADQSIKVGHLHTPYRGMTRDQMISKIREIITTSLPHI